jgi:hypothetical protein|tara:strand:- start:5050 stop:5343 length:294 start_codon:yes stop_codon:yes gene_type:complete
MKKILFIWLLFCGMSYGQTIRYDQLFYGYKTQHFKLTIKTGLNNDLVSQISSGDNIINLGVYDVRLKVYLSNRVSIVTRVIGNESSRFYSSGFIFIF